MGNDRKRISITKREAQSSAGVELLALCQTVTEDGVLSNNEIAMLRSWINANWSVDLPSAQFLKSILQRILEDGRVTHEERQELQKALETVLPPEFRTVAKERRKVIENLEKAELKATKEAERELRKSEAELVRRLYHGDFMVAGVHYEGRGDIVRQYVEEGEQVFLARDRNNKFSRNAVEIRLSNGFQIGYVPEDDASEMARLLDQGCLHIAYVKKVLNGAKAPIPVVVADIFRSDAPIKGAVREGEIPLKRTYGLPAAGSIVKALLAVAALCLLVALCSKTPDSRESEESTPAGRHIPADTSHAVTPPEPTPRAPVPRTKIAPPVYTKLSAGMTVEQVNRLLGNEGDKVASTKTPKSERTAYKWTLEGNVAVSAMFVDGSLQTWDISGPNQ